MAELEIRNLHVRAGEKEILRGLDLVVKDAAGSPSQRLLEKARKAADAARKIKALNEEATQKALAKLTEEQKTKLSNQKLHEVDNTEVRSRIENLGIHGMF